jgi:hypothetical protein
MAQTKSKPTPFLRRQTDMTVRQLEEKSVHMACSTFVIDKFHCLCLKCHI